MEALFFISGEKLPKESDASYDDASLSHLLGSLLLFFLHPKVLLLHCQEVFFVDLHHCSESLGGRINKDNPWHDEHGACIVLDGCSYLRATRPSRLDRPGARSRSYTVGYLTFAVTDHVSGCFPLSVGRQRHLQRVSGTCDGLALLIIPAV